MFVARAAAVLALLGAATPAAAGNLRHLKNGKGKGADVSPANEEGVCADVFEFLAPILGLDPAEIEINVDQSVVTKKGKGKYTCKAKGLPYAALAEALGVEEGPVRLKGEDVRGECETAFGVDVGCPCNPGEDPDSYDWTIQIMPSGVGSMKCKFQLPDE